MTVISTVITRIGTVHATESLLTKLGRDGKRDPIEWQATKIVPVRAWRGALSYWGLALVDGCWSTLDWLGEQAAQASSFKAAEAFTDALATELGRALGSLSFSREVDAGIGIHFSAYEWIDDRWIPELFLITNWSDLTNTALAPTGIRVSRETHATLAGEGTKPEDGEEGRRRAVSQALQAGEWLRYNNGDPQLYNGAANAIQDMLCVLASRRILREVDNIETLRSLGRRPVEVVSAIQQCFCAPGTRVVGGKIHDLLITPTGEYSSTSGDGA